MDGYLGLLGFIIGIFLFDYIVVKKYLSRWNPAVKSKKRIIVYVIILTIFSNFIVRIIFHEAPRPSPVDASLLVQLAPEQICPMRLEMALDSLQDRDKIWRFEKNERPYGWESSLLYFFSYGYALNTVRIMVTFHRNEQRLIDILPHNRRERARRGSTVITNDNNTQAFLHAAFMFRHYGFSVDHRIIRTELRLGSVHIDLREQRDRRALYPNASSDFIRLLYELLTAEE